MKKKIPYIIFITSIFLILINLTIRNSNITFAATVDNLTLEENAKVAYDITNITANDSSFNRYSIKYKSSTYIKGTITYKVNGVVENERFFLEPSEDYKVFNSFINGYTDNYSSTKSDIISLEFENISTEGTFTIDYFELLSYPQVDALISSINGSLSETAYQSDKTIFIGNDNLKVGFSLKYGGSINYLSAGSNIFSETLANKNIINSFDNGRLVQQCIYGNALFSDGNPYLTGEADNIAGRYNPIQGGEESHPSKIVDIGLSTDKKTLVIITKPSLWRVNNQNYLNKYYDNYYKGYTTDAYMLNTYTIYDNYVYTETSYIDFTDNVNTADGSTRSESPSVYPVSALNKFYAYDTATQKTNEYQIGPTVDENGFPQINDNKIITSPWGGYFATNNGITEGIGLYHPGYDSSYQYIKGFVAADKLTTDSKDPSTSFFTNIIHLDSRYEDGEIKQFKNFTYDYVLTLGNIDNVTTIMDTYRNDHSYKLTVNPNGGTFDNSSEVTTLSPDLLAYWGNWNNIGAATRTGYKLLGYYTEQNGGEMVYDQTGKAVSSSYWKISNRTETEYQYIGAKDLTVYARWEPITYTITYNLNGGNASNPTNYTVETNNFTLFNPTRSGYTFKGWSGTDITGMTTSVTIEKGSTGNKTYTANWEPNTYNINYNLNGGTATNNPTSYTIETNTFTINNPTKKGYTFKGWSGTGISGMTTNLTISKSSTGNKTYTANWEPITYTITYNLDGGTVSNNPTSYTIETNTFTINNPTKEGYTFTGWLGTELTENTKSLIIEKGSIGNREYTATWTEKIKDLEVKVDDYTYNSEKDIIKNIPIGTTKDNLLTKITITDGYTIKTDITDKVFTGSKIKISYEDKLYKEIINIVLGDTNGDSELSIFDIVKVNNHIIDETKALAEFYKLAADYNNDGTISVFDIVKMNNKIIAES